jgi:hypothetical protein
MNDPAHHTQTDFVTTTPIHRLVTNHGRVYDVYWYSATGDVHITGLPWSLTDAGETVYVGRVSSEGEAIKASEAAAYDRLSTFDKYVEGATLGKSEVIAVHLLVEHILIRCLYKVLPNPAPLFRGRTPSFSLLISLCEAHRIVSPDLAEILRTVNSLRNKCAHKLVFHPPDLELNQLLSSLREVSPNTPNEQSDPWPLLCELLEKRANELGATDI